MNDVDRRSQAGPPAPWNGRWHRLPARWSGPVYAVWSAGWITAFATGHWALGLPMMFATGALSAVVGRGGRRRGRPDRWRQPDAAPPPPVQRDAPPPVVPAAAPVPPERRLAAAVVRAESNRDRIDEGSLALVRELDGLLRPMLGSRGDAEPDVRHDIEAIAADHLPAVLDAYLQVAADAAHVRGAAGGTPADELRSQLMLLVEACTQLRDAIRAADVARQQQLGRFLEAKFRRSDLDL